jgi:hypothetical protein
LDTGEAERVMMEILGTGLLVLIAGVLAAMAVRIVPE